MSKKKKNSRAKSAPIVPKLPRQDLLETHDVSPPYEWQMRTAEVVTGIVSARKRGRAVVLPPAITSSPFTDLDDETYFLHARVLLWTCEMGTPGIVPSWAVRHPAIDARALLSAGVAWIQPTSGDLYLTAVHPPLPLAVAASLRHGSPLEERTASNGNQENP